MRLSYHIQPVDAFVDNDYNVYYEMMMMFDDDGNDDDDDDDDEEEDQEEEDGDENENVGCPSFLTP